MVSYEAIAENVIRGDADAVEFEVKKALNEGTEPHDILAKGLIGGMGVVGERFRAGNMFLPEVLLSASVMHKGLDIVKPLLAKGKQKPMGRIVIGTVEGDIHDIGKRIVGLLLEGNGYEVIDIGIDVKVEEFAKAVREYQPDILGMSALLTTTIPNIGKTINLLEERGLRGKVKIIVGGAQVTEAFAESVGADGYAPQAGSAVELVKRLLAS